MAMINFESAQNSAMQSGSSQYHGYGDGIHSEYGNGQGDGMNVVEHEDCEHFAEIIMCYLSNTTGRGDGTRRKIYTNPVKGEKLANWQVDGTTCGDGYGYGFGQY